MRPIVIRAPKHLGDKSLTRFFERWDWYVNLGRRAWVEFDFNGNEFVSPWALTLFATYALGLAESQDASITFEIDPETRSGRYMIQAGLLDLIDDRTNTGIAPTPDRTTKLTRISSSSEIAPFARSVMNLLQVNDEELEGALEYSLIELLRNVVQHSRSPVGGICMAQHYPNTGIVDIAVADIGMGVQAALSPRYGAISGDLHALKFALLPHVSGTFGQSAYGSMKDNAGLGLFFVKEIATRAGGGFFLGSGTGLVDLWGNADGSPGKQYFHNERGGWPGTFAFLQLRRERIGDFSALLVRCRELAAAARKDPSELALDFVDVLPSASFAEIISVASFAENVEEAARVREEMIIPLISSGQAVVLDFRGIRFATQSFAHACIYRVLRDFPSHCHLLSLARCTSTTKEAIRAVAAYAKTDLPA